MTRSHPYPYLFLSIFSSVVSSFTVDANIYYDDGDFSHYDTELDFDYDDLYDEFKQGVLEDHSHDFEENDEDGHIMSHHKNKIEKLSDKDYEKLSEEEKLFYRFKEADLDGNDFIDGLEIYLQLYKDRHDHFQSTVRKLTILEAEMEKRKDLGENKHVINSQLRLKNQKELQKMKDELDENVILKLSDKSLSKLDPDDDGLVSWAEYLNVVGKHIVEKNYNVKGFSFNLFGK